MRKILLLILITIQLISFGQKFQAAPYAKAGASWVWDGNISNGTRRFESSPALAYGLGCSVNYQPFSFAGLSVEPGIYKQGAKSLSYSLDSSIFSEDKQDFYYASIPVLLSFIYKEHYIVSGGAAPSFMIAHSNDRDFFNGDIMLQAALRYKKKRLTFGVEYSVGIVPLFTVVQIYLYDGAYYAQNFSMYNQAVYVSFSYNLIK